MQWRWAAFAVALTGSVALNGYLLLRREPTTRMPGGHRRVMVEHPVHHEPTPQPARPPAVVSPEITALDDQALAVRLAEAEKKLDAMLPLEQKFEVGERAAALEGRIRGILDDAFVADDGSAVPYDLECRGDICRVENVGLEGWQNLVSPALGMNQNRLSMSDSVYVQITDEPVAAARRLDELLLLELRASKDARACITPDAHHGTVTITFVLDQATRQIHARAGGALAGDVVGVCVRNVAEAIASKATAPAGVTELPDWPYPYEVP